MERHVLLKTSDYALFDSKTCTITTDELYNDATYADESILYSCMQMMQCYATCAEEVSLICFGTCAD